MNSNTSMKNARQRTRDRLVALVVMALFVALAYVCELFFRIKVSFLTFDIKDAVMAICAMFFGPLSGGAVALALSLIEFITVSDTGPWGLVMNFGSSATFVCVASAIYKYAPKIKKTLIGSIVGLAGTVIATTGVMMILNLVITPIYMGVERSQVVALIPKLLFPFNLTKAALNAGLVLVLYKPLSTAMYRAHVISGKVPDYKFDKKSVAVMIAGVCFIAICVAVFLLALNGKFDLGIK